MHVFITASWPAISEDERGSRIIVIIFLLTLVGEQYQLGSPYLHLQSFLDFFLFFNQMLGFVNFLLQWFLSSSSGCCDIWPAVGVWGHVKQQRLHSSLLKCFHLRVADRSDWVFYGISGTLSCGCKCSSALLWLGGLGLTGRRDGAFFFFLSVLLWLVLRYISSLVC